MKTYIVETVVGTIRTYQVEADSKKDIPDTLKAYSHPKVQVLSHRFLVSEAVTNIKRIKPESTSKGDRVFANMTEQLTREQSVPNYPDSDWWLVGGHP